MMYSHKPVYVWKNEEGIYLMCEFDRHIASLEISYLNSVLGYGKYNLKIIFW